MLNLRLRDEFLGDHTPGTVIHLRTSDNTGAAQRRAEDILEITFPTSDVQTALRVLAPDRQPRPIVLIGDKGKGKSHIMAVMHHAVASPATVEAWAHDWGMRLGNPFLSGLTLTRGFVPISEAVHNHEFPLLWDLLFARHPKGEEFRGRFSEAGDPYPKRSLLEKMFEAQPVALILDEFQKWFDGLHDEPGATGRKWRTVASNFVQNLSEISADRPDLLLLVVSVLNNSTEAFQQVHRNNPVMIAFQGPTAKRDRLNLLQHRLFSNRAQIPRDSIAELVDTYAKEGLRLRFSNPQPTVRDRYQADVADHWPFSPELIQRLEDHVLMTPAAQETREIIRILAAVYRARSERSPILTPADFYVDDSTCGVQALLQSITASDQQELVAVAERNLVALETQGVVAPLGREIVSAIWMRSMSPGQSPGGTRVELQLDCTRTVALDDNRFRDELQQIKDGCSNIHGGRDLDGRLWFALQENAETKVRATARNDKLWRADVTAPGQPAAVYSGRDIEHIRRTLRALLCPEGKSSVARTIVLGPQWTTSPWEELFEDQDRPQKWIQPVLLVLPETIDGSNGTIDRTLGKWLAAHVESKRNTVRFLLPIAGSGSIFADKDLIFSARCSYLTSQAWKGDPDYDALRGDFDRPLRDALKKRYDRFAIIARWSYKQPEDCRFSIERIDEDVVKQKGSIPQAIDEQIKRDLFDPAAFATLLIEYAKRSVDVGRLLDDLREPPPSPTDEPIPFLGVTLLYEEILKVAAKGKIILNVAGTWVGRQPDHADDDEAFRIIRTRAFRSEQELKQVQICLPGAAGATAVVGPTATPPAVPPATVPPLPLPPDVVGQPPQPQPVVAPIDSPLSAEINQTTPGPVTVQNLLGSFEQWGLSSDASLSAASLTFENLTVQQVKHILSRIPSATRARLSISYKKDNP